MIEVECYVQEAGDAIRDLKFDLLLTAVDLKLQSTPTLGGLIHGLSYDRPSVDLETLDGAPAIKSAVLNLTFEYDTLTPLT